VALIDDAIVDVDNITRRLRQAGGQEGGPSTMAIVAEAAIEMRSPLLYATLIMLLAVLPIFFLPGLTGTFFRPLAVSYVLAVLASLVVALVITPALSLLLQPKVPAAHHGSPLTAWLQRTYDRRVAPAVHSPRLAYALVGIVVVLGLVAVPFLGQSLVPSFKQTNLLIRWDAAPGTSHQEMNRILAQATRELRAIGGVYNVGSHIGRAETGDQIVGVNSGELWINLSPAADYDATVAAVREVVDGYPGLFRTVENYQPERLGEALTRSNQDVVVRLYGYELDVLRAKAQEIQQAMAKVSGVVEARADIVADEPQVEIEVDLAAAERFGIKPGDVRRSATTLLSGLHVGNLFEDQKVFDVVVWGKP
jgi:Cu/Ag efflux pump CusA